MALLEVKNLKTYFHTREGIARAVDGVSFSLDPGETIGIVGESGSGKSVACYSLLRLIPMPPGRIEGGSALFGGRNLLDLSENDMRQVRGGRIGMIFQDPMTSLNPYMKISSQLMEPLLLHRGETKAGALKRAIAELEAVGIQDASRRIHSFPHEFSGGMRQRVMIAMAMIARPEILIADEPTTALDVTVQRQVLDLIKQRQKDLGTAVIFITHDLAVVSEVCDRVNVMYAGRFVESAPVKDLFTRPLHPYTKALRKSIPGGQKKGEALHTIPGLPPNLMLPISGCAFAPRCESAGPECQNTPPPFVEARPGHWVQHCQACVDFS